MNPAAGCILSLAYIVGLLSTAIPQEHYGLLVLAAAVTVVLPYFWRTGSKPGLLRMAGIVGLLAVLYFQVRLPQPVADDISKFIPSNEVREPEQLVTVEGRVASMPRLTRTGRSQFWLETTQLNNLKGSKNKPVDDTKAVKGKLYVTVPLLQATGLYPGQAIALTGILYKLKSADLLGGFNFQAHLAREGAFAGFSGRQISFPEEPVAPQWKGWALRQRIIRSQVSRLGSPEGILLSSIILGSRVVDLPYEIKDQFVQVGLTHAITAYGFKICLILGLVLALTRRFSVRLRFGLGAAALTIYVALTGLHPLALRASVMGLAALIALVSRRKRKPWELIFVATALILLFNPLWIWDLELQLSFLATLGFLVTAQPIAKRLDWLSPALASLIAVPLAASLWTLPLQIYALNSSIRSSIPVNIIAAIPLFFISITGTISAIAASIWPMAGSTVAGVLYYPIHWLILLVQFFYHAFGSSATSDTISVLQLLALYGLLCLVWFQSWWQRQWWLAGLIAASLVCLPAGQSQVTGLRVTTLSTARVPILVIQDQGQVALINSGDVNTASSTVLPFLQQQGISQIDWAVAADSQDSSVGWPQILAQMPIKTLYFNAASKDSEVRIQEEEDISKRDRPSRRSLSASVSTNDSSINDQTTLRAAQLRQVAYQPLPVGETLAVGSVTIRLMSTEPPVLQLQIRDQTWLLLGDFKLASNSKNLRLTKEEKLASIRHLPHASVLCWSGELFADILKVMQPAVAITSSVTADSDAASVLSTSNVRLYWTGQDSVVQWTPSSEFETTLEATENDGSLL